MRSLFILTFFVGKIFCQEMFKYCADLDCLDTFDPNTIKSPRASRIKRNGSESGTKSASISGSSTKTSSKSRSSPKSGSSSISKSGSSAKTSTSPKNSSSAKSNSKSGSRSKTSSSPKSSSSPKGTGCLFISVAPHLYKKLTKI